MAIASIGQPTSAAPPSNTTVQLDDFLKVLTTQLSFQDPMKPMDNEQFMTQMAQFSSLQQAQQTNDNLVSLLQMQSAVQSVGLIGKTVEAANNTGGTSVGQVTTVRFVNGTPMVTLQTSDGQPIADVSLNSISLIR